MVPTQTTGTPSQIFETGTVIGGRYRLVEKIGEGGMATIWKAEHLVLGSPVAVKFLHPGIGRRNAQLVTRFMREARVAAAVRHRNVIEIKDFGVADDQRTPFMVMELLEGEALADRMEREPQMNVAFATHIGWLTLRGLAAVHDAGIVHRDLKPENIFLVDDPDGTYPKLLDFGVSRRAADSDITQEGLLIGTPSYMSPEQARGLRDIDVRTDIYSLGVMLWEMLAGRLPLDSDSPQELLRMIVQEHPPSLADIRPDIPQALVDVIAHAMSKKREDRFHDAREMRWALAQAGGLDMASERGSGVSRISEFPDIGTGKIQLKIPRDSQVSNKDAVHPHGAAITEEVEPLPPRENATVETLAPPRRRWPKIFVASFLMTALLGVATLAIVFPKQSQALLDELLGKPIDDPTWQPGTQGLSDEVLDRLLGAASTEVSARVSAEASFATNEPGRDVEFDAVRLSLLHMPAGSVASVDGVDIAGAETWVPLRAASYHIEVRRGETKLWEIDHPGDVDGEYEVGPTDVDEVAPSESPVEAVAEPEDTAEPDTDAIATPPRSVRATTMRRGVGRSRTMRRRAMR